MITRIAFPSNNRTNVEQHFGHCKEFAIYNIKDNQTASIDYVVPPAHAPGVLPKFLGEHNVNVIITGGMGAMAINLFKEQSIDVILGADGSINSNLDAYLGNELESKGSACSHDEGHNCGDSH
jgi:predicted Fe-Mo cluster-binding NifX family protein